MSARGPRSRRLAHDAPDPTLGDRRTQVGQQSLPDLAARGAAAADDLLVCRCEEVSRAEIVAAIDEGITTMSGLRRRLRIGMGLCQGRTCRRLLAQVLAERLGEQPADVRPSTFRPPVRPVSLRALADEGEAPLPPPSAGAADDEIF